MLEVLNSLRTDGNFCHQGRDTEIPPPPNVRLAKPTDMTIRWKALEEHLLMVPLVFRFNQFQGIIAFSEFFLTKLQSLELKCAHKIAQLINVIWKCSSQIRKL
jgi:hypothetical protein